jgi:hypothetical protein
VGICAGANMAVELGLVRLQRGGSNWYHYYNPAATLLLNTAHLVVPPAAHAAWQEVFGSPAPTLPLPVSFMHSPLLFPTDAQTFMLRVATELPEHLVPAEADASAAVEILALYADDLWAADAAACHVDATAAVYRRAGMSAAEASAFAAQQYTLDGAVAGASHPPPALMTSAAAVCRSTFGAGRVLLFSPHPEAACGGSIANQELVRRAVAWAAASSAASVAAAAISFASPSATKPDAHVPCAVAASTDFLRPCAHAVAALAFASTRNAVEGGCDTLPSDAICGAAAAAEEVEAKERAVFACVRHLRLGAYRRCAAAGCASNTRGVYACLACGVVLCGRGSGTHMGQHVCSAHGGGQSAGTVCVYFGVPQGFNGSGLMGGRGGGEGTTRLVLRVRCCLRFGVNAASHSSST